MSSAARRTAEASTRTSQPSTRVPMGPPWWGAVMGTGIIGTLTQLHVGTSAAGAGLARFFLIAGWILMVSFTATFMYRVARDRATFSTTLNGVGASAWGMVSMGILAVGASTATVLPAWSTSLAPIAWTADHVLWTIGTIIGFISTFGYSFALLKNHPGEPRPAWGLAIVPPMVSATCGAPFVAQIHGTFPAFTLLFLLVFCFVCSLTLGIVFFSAAYDHHARVSPIPVPLAASSWIPLGVVGQSTAAAQVIALQSKRFLSPEAADSALRLADLYGFVMLTIAIPLVTFAVIMTVRGFLRRMPFSPGWWALTFPVGTLSLGAFNLGKDAGLTGYSAASTVAWVVLLGTWTLCAVASTRTHLLRWE